MKKILLSALAVACSATMWAESSLDINGRVALRRARLEQQAPSGMSRVKAQSGAANVMSAIVQLAPGASASDLEGDGVTVLGSRHGFAFIVVDAGRAEDVSRLKCVRRMELGRTRSLKMDKARAASGVDKIHAGVDLPQPYTGKGVITGIVDGGFDPNHINFRNADGTSRIGQFTTVEINQGGIASGTDPVTIRKYSRDEIAQFQTDDNTQYHGTHTLGIMAGGYRGNASVAVQTGDASAEKQDMPVPYYGVAYDADIVASSGSSQDGLIAYAIDQLLEYRYYQDKPIVINISLGGNQGPHDGTGALSQFIDICAEDENAIFCLSAGNEGDFPIALHKTFTETDTEMQTFIRPFAYNDMRYGIVEFYSDDYKEFEVQAVLYNIERGKIIGRYPANNSYTCSSSDYQVSDNDIIDKATFGKYFDGYVGVNYAVDAETGRYTAGIDYYMVNTEANSPNNDNENYLLGFVVKSSNPGQTVYAYCDGQFTALDSYADKGIKGWSDGMYNGSISDLATGHNIVTVGSYNTRNTFAGFDGYMYSTEQYPGMFPVGDITNFSSFGTLSDGREMPMVVAPGATVISSFSNPYMRANAQSDNLLSANLSEEVRNNYYIQMQGTSMAAPHVAGSIALWLEAYPELTYLECIDIVKRTAIRDDAYDRLAPTHIGQGGLGKFDAYGGLKEVLKLASAGISGVSADRTEPLVVPAGERVFTVTLPGVSELRAGLYDLSGRPVLSASGEGELRLDCSALASGVYALRVNSASTRIVIR